MKESITNKSVNLATEQCKTVWKSKGYSIVSSELFIKKYSYFGTWLKDISRYGNIDSVILILRDINSDKILYKLKLYTESNEYSITFIPKTSDTKSYLGAGVTCRKSYPGEFWNRGNDLADGEVSKYTWDRIMIDIVRYELKTLSNYIRRD